MFIVSLCIATFLLQWTVGTCCNRKQLNVARLGIEPHKGYFLKTFVVRFFQ